MGFIDKYTVRARLFPALLVILPVSLGAIALLPSMMIIKGIIINIISSCGFMVLIAHMARGPGKNKENDLFKKWGGAPTTLLLRHREEFLDHFTKERYHKKLRDLIGFDLPTQEEEKNNPETADEKYISGVKYLREATRNKNFNVIHEENMDYGFRRNLWAMKSAGIATTVFSMVLVGLSFFVKTPFIEYSIICIIINTLMCVWWIFRINQEWVKEAAFSYAERLLAACDTL